MNKKMSAFLLTSTLLSPVLSLQALANTLVFWNNNEQAKVVARSMDLKENESPMLRTSPRGITRIGDLSNHHLSWQAKYGSVVVTAYQTNAATDGLNEQGLCVHLIPMNHTDYGPRDTSKPSLANALWVQYMLDSFATVDEALASLGDYQLVHTLISDKEVHAQLALQDATGDSALIEFSEGKPKVFHGHEYNVVTNQIATDIQVQDLSLYKPFGGELPLPGEFDANSRFIRAAASLKSLPTPQNPSEALAGVHSVIATAMVPYGQEASPTRWVSMADLNNQVFYFERVHQPGVIWVNLKKLNFKDNTLIMTLDPKLLSVNGDVTKQFKPEKKS